MAKSYLSFLGRKKSVVICNPITGNLPKPHEGERERRIVNWCRLDNQKNLDLLIDAFRDITDDFPEYVLYIYGEGPERKRLEQKIKDIKLEEKIFLPGHSNNIYDEVLKAALFVSSSDYEGISNSMLEAIALGIPTICTNCPVGGAREVIEDGINGLLIPVGDKNALKDAMVKVLTNEQFSKSLSKNGIMLREKISAKKIAEQWEEYIYEILKNNR